VLEFGLLDYNDADKSDCVFSFATIFNSYPETLRSPAKDSSQAAVHLLSTLITYAFDIFLASVPFAWIVACSWVSADDSVPF
jgi:hypothetical protein